MKRRLRHRYEVLRQFACRGGGFPSRLNAYVSYDESKGPHGQGNTRRARTAPHAPSGHRYKVIPDRQCGTATIRGSRYPNPTWTCEMGIDAILQSERLDRVLLASGDGDIVRVSTPCRAGDAGLRSWPSTT
jgi:uncharacterized LabA/DUF88 family protein